MPVVRGIEMELEELELENKKTRAAIDGLEAMEKQARKAMRLLFGWRES